MIAAGNESSPVTDAEEAALTAADFEWTALIRYGAVPQVARFGGHGNVPDREASVVVETDRGTEIGTALHTDRTPGGGNAAAALTGKVLRLAEAADLAKANQSAAEVEQQFDQWVQRAADWSLQLQIIDLEQTLDGQLIVYVLNDRGPETTRLALLAAAAGSGVIHVQPVGPDGIEQGAGGGGGCGDCGCSH